MSNNVIPMDQAAAADAEKRAQAEAKRATMYGLKVQLDIKKRDLKRHQQKLREITEVNATLLSTNGDLMIRAEMQRLEDEILRLKGEVEEVSKRP